jgi:hypothetical protein
MASTIDPEQRKPIAVLVRTEPLGPASTRADWRVTVGQRAFRVEVWGFEIGRAGQERWGYVVHALGDDGTGNGYATSDDALAAAIRALERSYAPPGFIRRVIRALRRRDGGGSSGRRGMRLR